MEFMTPKLFISGTTISAHLIPGGYEHPRRPEVRELIRERITALPDEHVRPILDALKLFDELPGGQAAFLEPGYRDAYGAASAAWWAARHAIPTAWGLAPKRDKAVKDVLDRFYRARAALVGIPADARMMPIERGEVAAALAEERGVIVTRSYGAVSFSAVWGESHTVNSDGALAAKGDQVQAPRAWSLSDVESDSRGFYSCWATVSPEELEAAREQAVPGWAETREEAATAASVRVRVLRRRSARGRPACGANGGGCR